MLAQCIVACAAIPSSSSFFQVWSLKLVFLFLLFLSSTCLAQQGPGTLQNVTISNQDPQITYSPFLCNTTNNFSFDASCNGGWQILDVDGQSVVATQGPSPAVADIVPQMFLRVRGGFARPIFYLTRFMLSVRLLVRTRSRLTSSLFYNSLSNTIHLFKLTFDLRTLVYSLPAASAVIISLSPLSNATINVTVSAGSTSVTVAANSSLGVVGIFNMIEAETTTITITYIVDAGVDFALLDIGSITAQVTNGGSASSILPTMTLPPSVSIPTFVAPQTSSPSASPSSTAGTSSSSHKQLVADAVGLTVGLGLGLTAVCVLGYLLWIRRRRKRRRLPGDTERQEQQQSPTSSSVFSRFRTRRSKDNQDTRWF
ncbi:hypothetical protein K435DRAFT_860071 [Dendrothele bispora CBS 962.96]|uniref:Mid2 domain-containing protein n=1 Tax=Dendrothele bispora (strain CBS 962.96) TaxID=1314807 RepID=A0A4S8LYW8_DENBC|nr:hypothetical protein K435DRAFT_860071 [Dendrothele bispora CBS 962.96]